MQQVEEHAYHTMTPFSKSMVRNSSLCHEIAINYYREGDLYLMNFKLRGFPKNVVPRSKISTMCSLPSEMTN